MHTQHMHTHYYILSFQRICEQEGKEKCLLIYMVTALELLKLKDQRQLYQLQSIELFQ